MYKTLLRTERRLLITKIRHLSKQPVLVPEESVLIPIEGINGRQSDFCHIPSDIMMYYLKFSYMSQTGNMTSCPEILIQAKDAVKASPITEDMKMSCENLFSTHKTETELTVINETINCAATTETEQQDIKLKLKIQEKKRERCTEYTYAITYETAPEYAVTNETQFEYGITYEIEPDYAITYEAEPEYAVINETEPEYAVTNETEHEFSVLNETVTEYAVIN
ncbi:unnamed protein product [Mytilus edulis]|uniref:Uncharacterized protein n=1 Tax=Mytilus edulis TaxID=6550 RepID=A0A8S3VQL1_MYTED|nr:unnamed protein product [Mytilus edulis]